MRRFWKDVHAKVDGIYLDDKPLKTPAGRAYLLPTAALMAATAQEWRDVDQVLRPADMPLTQLAATALDVMPSMREQTVEQLASYAVSDLLCYRVSHPEALALRQNERWQPYLDWAAERFDALLRVSIGIQVVSQNQDALRALRHAIEQMDDFRLVGLQQAVTLSGSLVLGLALVEQHADAADVFHAAELDAQYQAEHWGHDDEAAARQKELADALMAVERFLDLLRR